MAATIKMVKKPKVIVLRAAGTNCDCETAFAFQYVGAKAERVHINELRRGSKKLSDYDILALPGGFSYGDDIASGKILANELRFKLQDEVSSFIESGKLIIGICNGFQVLVKAGILPGILSGKIQATLMLNDSGKYEDRWVYLKKKGRCIWTKNLPEAIYLPVAHGEGKFLPADKNILNTLWHNGQIALQYYLSNPNGSVDNIAGICDPTGRVFGLMPHPERHLFSTQHPRWTRGASKKAGDGVAIFENGVRYARKYL